MGLINLYLFYFFLYVLLFSDVKMSYLTIFFKPALTKGEFCYFTISSLYYKEKLFTKIDIVVIKKWGDW